MKVIKYKINNFQKGAKLFMTPTHKIIKEEVKGEKEYD